MLTEQARQLRRDRGRRLAVALVGISIVALLPSEVVFARGPHSSGGRHHSSGGGHHNFGSGAKYASGGGNYSVSHSSPAYHQHGPRYAGPTSSYSAMNSGGYHGSNSPTSHFTPHLAAPAPSAPHLAPLGHATNQSKGFNTSTNGKPNNSIAKNGKAGYGLNHSSGPRPPANSSPIANTGVHSSTTALPSGIGAAAPANQAPPRRKPLPNSNFISAGNTSKFSSMAKDASSNSGNSSTGNAGAGGSTSKGDSSNSTTSTGTTGTGGGTSKGNTSNSTTSTGTRGTGGGTSSGNSPNSTTSTGTTGTGGGNSGQPLIFSGPIQTTTIPGPTSGAGTTSSTNNGTFGNSGSVGNSGTGQTGTGGTRTGGTGTGAIDNSGSGGGTVNTQVGTVNNNTNMPVNVQSTGGGNIYNNTYSKSPGGGGTSGNGGFAGSVLGAFGGLAAGGGGGSPGSVGGTGVGGDGGGGGPTMGASGFAQGGEVPAAGALPIANSGLMNPAATASAGALPDNVVPAAASQGSSNADADRTTMLSNPNTSPGAVNFLVDGTAVAMQPGYSQALPGGRTCTVRFDRGNGRGEASYAIGSGSYKFVCSPDTGWDLQACTFQVALDNTAGNTDFHYVLDGTVGSVSAGQTAKLTSQYPVVVRFDPGNGLPVAVKHLDEGSYKIAVDPRRNAWDLLPTSTSDVISARSNAASLTAGN